MKPARLCVLLVLAFSLPAFADVHLSDDVTVVFATKNQTNTLLAANDDYMQRLTAFDRQAKTQSSAPVSHQDFVAHHGAQGMSWSGQERARFTSIFESIRAAMSPYVGHLPTKVVLAKTSGKEEAGAFYTRADAIFIPQTVMTMPDSALAEVMLHELFHVLSRADSDLRDRLYASIGFVKTSELVLPEPLTKMKISNPDVPIYQHLIKVKVDGANRWATPIIYSGRPYDPEVQVSFFPYIKLELLIYDWDGESAPVAATKNGEPHLVAMNEVGNFFDQIGRNTQYLFHAEEILASNFVFLALGQEVAEPAVLKRMQAAFDFSL